MAGRRIGWWVAALGLAGCGSAATAQVEAFELSSAAFSDGETIPARHTCDGPGLSPPLSWTEPGRGTQSLVLRVEEASEARVVWALFDIPTELRGLPTDAARAAPAAARRGRNDSGSLGYAPPCPAVGRSSRLVFRLFALDTALGLPDGAAPDRILSDMEGHVLATAELAGTIDRRRPRAQL